VLTSPYPIIGSDSKSRTRIAMRLSSYLDGGTEVVPGERKWAF